MRLPSHAEFLAYAGKLAPEWAAVNRFFGWGWQANKKKPSTEEGFRI
jgi:hypothetical protein